MTAVDAGSSSPWRTLWDGRLRRSSMQMAAGLALAVGMNLCISDRISWWEIAITALCLEVMLVIVGDPSHPPPPAPALLWFRGIGQRMIAYGALASVASGAGLAQFAPLTGPYHEVLLGIAILVFGAGGVSVILGAHLMYLSYPRVRRWNRAQRGSPAFFAVTAALGVCWVGLEVFDRAQRTGAWEAVRIVGLALLIVGCALALLNAPTLPAGIERERA